MAETAVESLLAKGLDALALDQSKRPQLMQYLELLLKWNRAYNLTATRKASEVVTRHLLDSLAVVQFIKEGSLCDVGTGGGFPGIPLAIYFPDRQINLVDSNGKKTRFLAQVKANLELTNVCIYEKRVETCQLASTVDGVISRAFADLSDMCCSTRHMLSSHGCWYAMKSQHTETELANLPDWVYLKRRVELSVPGLGENRELLVLSPNGKY